MKAIFAFGLIFLAGLASAADVKIDLGTPATIEQFPSIVQVEVGYGPLWLQGCAGIVLTNLHALSAARCFIGRIYSPTHRRIRAGTSIRNEGGEIFYVQQEHNHPSFRENGFDGDITVVRLQTPFNLGATIQMASIINQGNVLSDGSAVVAAGWGSIAQGTIIANRDLHSVDLVTVNNEECAEVYGSLLLPITVTTNMVCSGRPDTGSRIADLRDAGGPIYFSNVVIGVNSFGHYIRNTSYPLVATAVSSYTNWIVATAV